MAINIQPGTYNAIPTKSRIYNSQSGNLTLEVSFALCDENWEHYTNENGYPLEMRKWFNLVSADGTVKTMTINRIKEWADGFEPTDLDSIYNYFVGENFAHINHLKVKVVIRPTEGGQYAGNPEIAFVNSLNRKAASAAPVTDDNRSAITAKFGAKFRAAFAATPKKVVAPVAKPVPAPVPEANEQAPSVPKAPTKPVPAPKAQICTSTEGECWNKYLASLPEGTDASARDAGWFKLLDAAGVGDKDPDQMSPTDWGKVDAAIVPDQPF